LKDNVATMQISLVTNLLAMPRLAKRLLVAVVDSVLCVLTVWLAYYLRLGDWARLFGEDAWDLNIAIIGSLTFALPVFFLCGLYRVIFRYSGLMAAITVMKALAIYFVLYAFVFTVIGVKGVPRTIGIIQPILLLMFLIAFRSLVPYWFSAHYQNAINQSSLPQVLIYGAGINGRQLADALANSREMRVLGFMDDAPWLVGQTINGKRIYRSDELTKLVAKHGVSDVLLAMPSINQIRRNEILQKISAVKVNVRTLPSLNELAKGKVKISDLRDLDFNDLIGRDVVPPDQALLDKNIKGKVVMVTGAGGSIGGELCRQILDVGPSKLLLLELSEFALYQIHDELEAHALEKGVALISLLASVQDAQRIHQLMSTLLPDTVFHAAAYKHVPLVEHNPAEGIKNNVFGTLTLAQIALANHVKSFVLISTDKAVRSANVMGATKRLSEMVLQALAANRSNTTFAIVRFGNVLGSSGSVIPKFRRQIKERRPITLTHPDITRYFMTITEAAQLVIQASAMAEGGEVFVLDMGEPIKIMDLARNVIKLSGMTVKDASNPEGDIEIEITGLRPGEKLFEELLIGDDPKATKHPRIIKVNESYLTWTDLESWLKELGQALAQDDHDKMMVLLRASAIGYQPNSDIADWTYLQSQYQKS